MSALSKAKEAYGGDVPDWVEVLALEADRTSQSSVARRLSYTPGAINSVLGNTYRANTQNIENSVRGVLMDVRITCPMLGEIGPQKCTAWRLRARKGNAANSLHKRMAAACRACPRSKPEGSET
ncbi:hypothetical protein [uncultured Tateyamaria sp.]|uniref:hypothetical protein n=1 Tax=uncultured Tateyamaria sp. TaxID=455651 RepID=UPI0026220C2D|nr:hypothetical protein [uncultured Tateyamaria sp.]